VPIFGACDSSDADITTIDSLTDKVLKSSAIAKKGYK
jgi:hypothetical protein